MLALAAPLAAAAGQQATTPAITDADLRLRLGIFADDSMRGREAGTEDHRRATRYLAAELGPRAIRVNAVSPGPMQTRAASGIPEFDRLLEDARERAPLRRPVELEDVGTFCAFLVSDAAAPISGAIIPTYGA